MPTKIVMAIKGKHKTNQVNKLLFGFKLLECTRSTAFISSSVTCNHCLNYRWNNCLSRRAQRVNQHQISPEHQYITGERIMKMNKMIIKGKVLLIIYFFNKFSQLGTLRK